MIAAQIMKTETIWSNCVSSLSLVGAIIPQMIISNITVDIPDVCFVYFESVFLRSCASMSGINTNLASATTIGSIWVVAVTFAHKNNIVGMLIMLIRWLSVLMLSASAGFPPNSSLMNATDIPAGTAVAMSRPVNISGCKNGLASSARRGVARTTSATTRYTSLCVSAVLISLGVMCRHASVINSIRR